MQQRYEDLDHIIRNKQIKTVFQPIISLRDGSVLGHEALSRITCESTLKDPDSLFTAASEYNRLWDLEQLCRTTALEAAYPYMVPPSNKKLFINVNPHIMHDDSFKTGFTKAFLKQYDISPHNIIFEISEKDVIGDMEGFKATIEHYRSQDYKIAVDDAGSGYSGLNLITDVNPNYIKLDMKLIRNIHEDRLKYALVKGMVEFSNTVSMFLIAEGIETYEELDTLIHLGVHYGQGYFIQKPQESMTSIRPEIGRILKDINLRKNHLSQNPLSDLYIKNLCTPILTVSPNEKITHLYDMFKRDANCFGVVVTENQMPVGIMTRDNFIFHLSGHYGYSLYQNKVISKLMDRKFLAVDSKTPVSLVSSMAMSRSSSKLYDFIAVTEEGALVGVVTIKDLLLKTTEIEISAARHQNPLTGLPGNLTIDQKLTQCIADRSPYSVFYIDIDNFKAYNDLYGFENGDLIIKLLADLLRKNISNEPFIGHIGGDDFVVIFGQHVNENYLDDMIHQFETAVLACYNQEDIQNRYISAPNRNGVIEKFPLMTLTVVSVNNKARQYHSQLELTQKLASLKKHSKNKKAYPYLFIQSCLGF